MVETKDKNTKEGDHMNTQAAIEFIAREHQTTPEQVKADMQEAIDAAKGSDGFKAVFGDREPSVEEFIMTVVNMLRAED